MSSAWKGGSPSLIAYGVLTVVLGMLLSVCGTVMTKPITEELGYLLAEVFTGFCLLVASVFAGMMRARGESTRNIAIYLGAWTASVVLWFVCWLLQPARDESPLLLSLTGLHGLFWGLWCVGLALQFRALKARAAMLCLFGGSMCSAGILLATRTGISRLAAVTAAACFMLLLGTQILFTAIVLHREFAKKKVLAA
ncbi:hypothetical protein DYQ86_26095 [Acidobacteria bacterium AB60]|nr:hypothetical protein DYQ86_26095 [Acidobacteria bacterium AB60]